MLRAVCRSFDCQHQHLGDIIWLTGDVNYHWAVTLDKSHWAVTPLWSQLFGLLGGCGAVTPNSTFRYIDVVFDSADELESFCENNDAAVQNQFAGGNPQPQFIHFVCQRSNIGEEKAR